MKSIDVSIPEVAFVAATRGMAGAGIGLLLSNYLTPATRRAVGWTLLGFGAVTTLPIAITLFYRSRTPLFAD